MKEPMRESIGRWSLKRVQFLLSHIEGFIEDDLREVQKRAKDFQPASGLESIERLVETGPSDPELPVKVLEKLSLFFDSGLLLQHGTSAESGSWWITDLFWRGNTFHLEVQDQVRANTLIPEITPLQVHRAPAQKILTAVKMEQLAAAPEALGYLLKPTPTVSYVLFGTLPAPWAADHIAAAHKLVNKCFIY